VEIPAATTPPSPAAANMPNMPNTPAPEQSGPTSNSEPNAADAEPHEAEGDGGAERAAESSNGVGEMSNNPRAGEPFGATSEVDVRTLWEQSHEKPRETPASEAPGTEAAEPNAPSAASAPNASTGRGGGARPIDLASSEGVDANVLDDDAFFATLRDAVHDEKPLGPREEGDDPTGENRFFDQDADRGTFRDVFRRRR
jgi:hypothetical protein